MASNFDAIRTVLMVECHRNPGFSKKRPKAPEGVRRRRIPFTATSGPIFAGTHLQDLLFPAGLRHQIVSAHTEILIFFDSNYLPQKANASNTM